MRRLPIILGFVAVVAMLGILAYILFFRNTGGLEVGDPSNPSLPTAGSNPLDQPTTVDSVEPGDTTQPTGTPGRLAQISKGPVVPGAVVTALPSSGNASSTDLVVRYIERKSGNVFHYNIQSGGVTRTSNRTVPGIISAAWSPDASTAFVRYLSGTDFSTVNTYALSAAGIEGYFLPQNLSGIAVASTGVLTLATGVNGSVASLSSIEGGDARNVFTTPLTQLRASFAGNGRYLAFTKPSAALGGSAFLTDATGRLSRLAGPYRGLVALASPAGTWVLLSYVQNDALQLRLVNTRTNESIALPLGTIADKCAWSTDETFVYCGVPIDPPIGPAYPDDWYQGVVHFSDRIWKIDVTARYAQLVLDFSQSTGSTLDAEALALDSLGTTLTFMNKNDRSLWVYKL